MEFVSIRDSSLNPIIRWAWSSWNFQKWCINQKALCITDSSHWWLLAREKGWLISTVARFWWVWCFDRFWSMISSCFWYSIIRESLSSSKGGIDARFITYLWLTSLYRIGWWTWCDWFMTKVFLFCAKSEVWGIRFSWLHSFVCNFHMWVVNIRSWWTFILA